MLKYVSLLCLGLIAYAGVLVAAQLRLAQGIDDGAIEVLLSVLPMLPALFICGVVVTGIRDMDELQRKVQFEALALAFAGTALITFTYGFLEGAGFPKLSMFVVWPLMAGLWVVGVMMGRLRYG
ncbi:hypothetical protein [Tritonibacter mobilis]|uniref:hypothetical protein n=1 Tax=Tritonibacter mobilis TaxID=379347 RepID=UPI001C086A24|nr:hypothetical protein [Tritonibacter mobilis]MBU3032726.1 hypothetical protein [Tritonibacter mobilis]WHQ81919.1 hypothetical protein OMR53_12015 [Tritonibacter mobilis]